MGLWRGGQRCNFRCGTNGLGHKDFHKFAFLNRNAPKLTANPYDQWLTLLNISSGMYLIMFDIDIYS